MKKLIKKQIALLLIAALCMVDATGCAAADTTQSAPEQSESVSGTDSAAEETVEQELAFTRTKKSLKCGNTFRFKVNKSGVTWSVSNPKKAAISKKGNLRAKRYGKVRVIATSGDESISFVVKLRPKKTIGIDPGHQSRGNNGTEPVGPGSSTMKTKVAGGTRGVSTGKSEYQLTLEIGLALKEELKDRGYKVVMTRSTNDVNITNKERAEKLNKSCDVAIRLHADGGAASAQGASALYPSTSNPYVAYLSADSKRLSESVIGSYCAATGVRNRGLSQRDDLTGTNWSTIPVTLLEMGFMTNSSDDTYMSSASGQAAMVRGISDGIDTYFGN